MIKIKKILYPTDFSESSLEALKYALSFAKEYRAKLVILHVINENIFTESLNLPRVVSIDTLEKEMVREAEKRMKSLLPAATRKTVERETVILKGAPFLEIIRFAREKDIDLIIIGTHGRSGFQQIIFGSTAEKVVRKAPCPVLSVKPAQREFVMP
jgi:nucleotide-binding universal stress UspA family protein